MKGLAIVTGANRGLGFETCRQLARLGYPVLLAARDAGRGEQAAAQLRSEGLNVSFAELDVADADSMTRFADALAKRQVPIDILVNNAGVLRDPHDKPSLFDASLDDVRQTLETNLLGPLRLVQLLVPLLSEQGRIVNVSSGMGQLSDMNGGYAGYRLSKTGLNALTRMLADELKAGGIKVNSACPGWVQTDMGGPNATRTPSEGADTIVWLATLPADGPSGGFFRNRQPIAW